MLGNIYKKVIIDFSKITLLILILIIGFSLYQSKKFNLDASSDALLLEGDPDLKFLREVNQTYGTKDFLVLTYTPVSSFTEKETILDLQLLKSKIEKLTWVDSVVTVIDVPLLKSTDEGLMDRLKNYKTLAYPDIDRERGFDEILNSPIYKNYVISEDGKTSGIVVYLKEDKRLAEYIKIKDRYYNQSAESGLSEEDKLNYKKFLKEYEDYKNLYNVRNHQNIVEIRDIINRYGENAQIFLGGIPMIADDMMSFIKTDIIVFGIGVFIFIILTLWFIFRDIKWVIMPLLGCATSVIIMTGLLGFLGWKVTVISSNFIALMLILNMAMNIHVTVRFLQLKKEFPEIPKSTAVLDTCKKMSLPILYTVLTTICAFLSLIFSGIKPIIDFGWMMTLGLVISFFITFLLLPVLLNLLSSEKEISIQDTEKSIITSSLASFTKNNKLLIYIITVITIFISLFGIFKLEVENRNSVGKKASKKIRRAGKIPSVLYYRGEKPVSLSIDKQLLHQAIKSDKRIYEVEMDSEPQYVMIKDAQYHPITDEIIHVDFMRVRRSEKMTISVPITLVGKPVGVTEGGILSQSMTQVEISCYPTDVPEQIELNIDQLELNSGLSVGDIDTGSEDIEVISDVNLNIVSIMAPVSEKEDDSTQDENETSESKDDSKEMNDGSTKNNSDENTES